MSNTNGSHLPHNADFAAGKLSAKETITHLLKQALRLFELAVLTEQPLTGIDVPAPLPPNAQLPADNDINFYPPSSTEPTPLDAQPDGESLPVAVNQPLPSKAELQSDFMAGLTDLAKAQNKTVRGVAHPAADFAVVRDPDKPATWAILLSTNRVGEYTYESLRRAAILLTPGTPALKALGLSPEELTGATRRIRAELRKLNVDVAHWPASVRKALDVDGKRWFAVFSNNCIDNDYPPDIFSLRAHKAYAYLVKQGVVAPPELWIWHIPGTALGRADIVDVTEDGFIYAAGFVYPGQEAKLRKLAATSDWGVSHSAPLRTVIRRPHDRRVIDFYITTEVSVLPRGREANPLTSFHVKKEQHAMQLTDSMRAALTEIGYEAAEIEQIDSVIEKHAALAEAREKKDQNEEPAADPAPDAAPAFDAAQYVTRDEMEELIRTQAAMIAELRTGVNDITDVVKQLKVADEEKVAKAAQMTPRASLSELMAQFVVGNPAAQLDGRAALAKAGPKEQPAAKNARNLTGVEFIDNLIAPPVE